MNMSFQLEKLKNAMMDFINSQQSKNHNFGIARRKRKSLCAKGKRAQVRCGRLVLTLNSHTKGEAL
jgi:hypothetical protein